MISPSSGNPFSYCFLPSFNTSSEMLPKLINRLPGEELKMVFPLSSINGFINQNSMYSTFACSKSVEVICLVIPAQLSSGLSIIPSSSTSVWSKGSKLYGPLSVGLYTKSKVFITVLWPWAISISGKTSSINTRLV